MSYIKYLEELSLGQFKNSECVLFMARSLKILFFLAFLLTGAYFFFSGDSDHDEYLDYDEDEQSVFEMEPKEAKEEFSKISEYKLGEQEEIEIKQEPQEKKKNSKAIAYKDLSHVKEIKKLEESFYSYLYDPKVGLTELEYQRRSMAQMKRSLGMELKPIEALPYHYIAFLSLEGLDIETIDDEQLEYVKENIKDYTEKELIEHFNELRQERQK